VPTVIVARTDAQDADLLLSDIDEADREFMTGERTGEGFHRVNAGIDQAIARGVAYAPYADLVWCETAEPDIDQAKRFAEAIHAEHPGKLLAYNCSPSFNWKSHLSDEQLLTFQKEIGELGYRFQFITLAGFHTLNFGMFDLAHGYRDRGMAAYAELQQREVESEDHGYTATKHQREVGAGYFDQVAQVIAGGEEVATAALTGSTEDAQF
jgi:isocitrate lyase